MKMLTTALLLFALASVQMVSLARPSTDAPVFGLNDKEYFEAPGVSVMCFQDFYPEGHQGGVTVVQQDVRTAANGDLRLEPTPGQWAPVPKLDRREVNRETGEVSAWLSYPDPGRNRKGFNPIEYPDLAFSYHVRVRAEGDGVRVSVDLSKPLPKEWAGRVGFNLELFPVALFGRTWYLDGRSGIFPRQPGGPSRVASEGGAAPAPLATGRRLAVAPESDSQRLIVESRAADLALYDGRDEHNNGWFIVRSVIGEGATTNAIDWFVRPHSVPGWKSAPVVHVSQVGYEPKQQKIAVLETDVADRDARPIRVRRISENGGFEDVKSGVPTDWGRFLRYAYRRFDFRTSIDRECTSSNTTAFETEPFRIADDVFDRGVWQPALEYFLPAQMCHMRVEEKYKVWHGACHLDDARMAPTDLNHFDGYMQGPSTLTTFKPGEHVPGLNAGGWHDAGDDDFRIESQADEVYVLASAYESFGVDYDDTTIDEAKHLTRIHQPDGTPDLLQQVEHGILTILGGYRSLGRVYRGVIVPTLQQYVMVGDTSNSTDNTVFDDAKTLPPDDRWVFTEENPDHEYKAMAALAIAARVLGASKPDLARECTAAAEDLWSKETEPSKAFDARVIAAAELLLTTRKPVYARALTERRSEIVSRIGRVGWTLGRVLPVVHDEAFTEAVRAAVKAYEADVAKRQESNPFGVPYEPVIWGAGWQIQEFGFQQYFLHRGFPDLVGPEAMLNALNFVLGCHPGRNTASFASGVGAKSMTVAYGFNRADYTYIPGGVVSGTALIRPDLPELKDFPYLWQQAEYVMGGGATNFMFLALAARQMSSARHRAP